jgi:hypothetical protein
MLFALTDVAQYLLRNGPYSDGALSGGYAFLATPEEILQLNGVRDGDQIFCHPLNSLTSWVIMYVTASPWSHVGMLTSAGTVLEAITQGVVERPATCYFDGKHYLLIKRLMDAITDQQRREMVSLGRSHVGVVKYDFRGAIRLGLSIIFGFNSGWQIRCSIDVVMFLCTLALLARALPWLGFTFIVLSGIYMAVVFAGTRTRRKQREQMAQVNRELRQLAYSHESGADRS